jgi:hypothetical protein
MIIILQLIYYIIYYPIYIIILRTRSRITNQCIYNKHCVIFLVLCLSERLLKLNKSINVQDRKYQYHWSLTETLVISKRSKKSLVP